MGANSSSIDLRNCELKFVDGTSPTPKEMTFVFDEGEMTVGIRQEYIYRKNRGKLAGGSVKEGDEQPMEISISGRFTGFSSTADSLAGMSALQFLRGGTGTQVIASTGPACDAFCVDLELTESFPDGCDPGYDAEVSVYERFYVENIDVNYVNGQFTATGKCWAVYPSATRP
jgi:hypothetical protein